LAGFSFDSDATTIDWRAALGDGGAVLATLPVGANGVRVNATITADRYYLVRVEIKPNGIAEMWFGDIDEGDELKLIATGTAALGTADLFFAVLMLENRSGANERLEVDYFYARGFRDWSAS
jgi:hypothetical protein